MELLFIWINRSDNMFINKQGINFYGEHRFSLMTAGDPQKYILSYTPMQNGFNLFRMGCIKNITAIVGENGAGKTTLFKCLYSNDCLPRQGNDDPNYDRMNEEWYEANKRVLIYRLGEHIEIIHNLEPGTFVNETEFTVHSMNEINQDERVHFMELMEQQTIIYLSNSSYATGFDGFQTHGRVNSVSLTAASLKHIGGKFYKKIVNAPEFAYINSFFIVLQELLIKNKSVQDFQQICDVLYYHNLYTRGIESPYLFKECKSLYVDFLSVIRAIEKIDGFAEITRAGFQTNNPDTIRLAERIKGFLAWIQHTPLEIRKNIFATAYLNTIFEIYYCWECIALEDYPIVGFEDFSIKITAMIDLYEAQQEHNQEQVEYYRQGLREIDGLFAIIGDCNTFENNVPEGDLAYRYDKVVSYNDGIDTFLRFCAFIDSVARKRHSLILKYIKIDNLYMSSGERAYQNFFSWLNLPTKFDEYIEGTPIPINNSVLLLIDEIDLYMHPEWQRQAIKTLIEELSRQYSENEIQIIISTHSPLVLSDIPKQNTIYLKPEEGKFNIENSNTRPQTFGANIHTLLNDAFFLSSTMGSFAYSMIKKISDDLLLLRRNPADEGLKNICMDYKPYIELIGEPLIRNKLISIFNECFPELHAHQLEAYRERILTLTHQLQEGAISRDSAAELKETLQRALRIVEAFTEGAE